MCHNCAPPATVFIQHLLVAALTQAVRPDIGLESRFLPTPPAFDAPLGGGVPSEYFFSHVLNTTSGKENKKGRHGILQFITSFYRY